MQFCQSARILPKFRVNNVEINAFPDDRALAEAAAEQWVAEMGAAVQASTRYCVALSGGRIARRLFTALAGMAKARPQPLGSVHFFGAMSAAFRPMIRRVISVWPGSCC